MKKILFFINTLNGGGAEKVLTDIVNHLNPKEYNITLQTVFDVGVYQKQLKSHIHYKSIFSYSKLFSWFWSRFLCHRVNPERFYKRFVKADYDIEVAFLEGFPTKILASSKNPEKYAWVHTDLYNYYGHKKLFRSVEENKICYLNYKKIICVSETAKAGFYQRFGELDNVIVQYNPVDEKTILGKAQEPIEGFVVSQNKLKLITVGRLVYQKGYDRLLRIHKKLIDDGFSYELWILGDGNERTELGGFILENWLSDSVKLLGFQKNPYQFMKAADLFVCSSRAEGYSTVVAEALICGLPVISTDCSGAKELLGDSEYGLVTENNEEALYFALKRLLSDSSLLMNYKKKSQERGMHFLLQNRMEEIERILNG